jgi:hypothetical protein
MMLLERFHEVSHLTLRLCGQRVNVVQEELVNLRAFISPSPSHFWRG